MRTEPPDRAAWQDDPELCALPQDRRAAQYFRQPPFVDVPAARRTPCCDAERSHAAAVALWGGHGRADS